MARAVDTETRYSTIGAATTLGWAQDECARVYMQQLLVRGHAILSAHGWKIKLMREFYPRSGRLLGLNVNKGDEVCIRFRSPGAKNTFLPFNEVLCTLLHEITHCRYSRHDRYFWELYTKLVAECERLEVRIASQELSNLSGQLPRFTGAHRLGGNAFSLLPSDEASRRRMLANAAEGRMHLSRRNESIGCMRGGAEQSNSMAEGKWVCTRCQNTNASDATTCDFCSEVANGDAEEWNCKRCAFLNYCNLHSCEACSFSRLLSPDDIKFGVQRIKLLPAHLDFVLLSRFISSLVHALNPILEERQWQLVCLEEIPPQVSSVVSRGELMDAKRLVVRVRLRSSSCPSELLPLAYVCIAVFHQLAHIVERNHGVAFLEVWASLLQRCLDARAQLNEGVMDDEMMVGVSEFTRQVQDVLGAQKCVQRGGRGLSLLNTLDHRLFADCGTLIKRSRSPDASLRARPAKRSCTGRCGKWTCTRCSFVNHMETFLFCEMCGVPRLLCPLPSGVVGASHQKPIIIVDDDDLQECGSNTTEEDEGMMMTVN